MARPLKACKSREPLRGQLGEWEVRGVWVGGGGRGCLGGGGAGSGPVVLSNSELDGMSGRCTVYTAATCIRGLVVWGFSSPWAPITSVNRYLGFGELWYDSTLDRSVGLKSLMGSAIEPRSTMGRPCKVGTQVALAWVAGPDNQEQPRSQETYSFE